MVLHILLLGIQQELIKRCPDAAEHARLGAVSFIHRFGDALNEHIHFHCCVIDALFYFDDGELRISELPALSKAEFAAIQTRVSQRVLRWFVRRGWLDTDDARAMREWHSDGGFSLDASVRIPGWDRAGLERLLRYCARPTFALERLEAIDDEHLRYHFSKPQADGATELQLTPLELIDRIAALVPPPRLPRHRYHGVLAPNSPHPPAWEDTPVEVDQDADLLAQPEPEVEFDQRVQW